MFGAGEIISTSLQLQIINYHEPPRSHVRSLRVALRAFTIVFTAMSYCDYAFMSDLAFVAAWDGNGDAVIVFVAGTVVVGVIDRVWTPAKLVDAEL